MKLKNRIMSWILHPAAYMVWHAAGAPEEWSWWNTSEGYRLLHKPSGVVFWVKNGPIFFDEILATAEVTTTEAIGYFDRHLVWWRIARVVRYLNRIGSSKQKLFAKMTQLTGKP